MHRQKKVSIEALEGKFLIPKKYRKNMCTVSRIKKSNINQLCRNMSQFKGLQLKPFRKKHLLTAKLCTTQIVISIEIRKRVIHNMQLQRILQDIHQFQTKRKHFIILIMLFKSIPHLLITPLCINILQLNSKKELRKKTHWKKY